VWKKLFHGVENFWRKGGRRVEFFHGVENFFPWRGKAGLELAEGEVAVDFIDGAVAVYVQDGVGEGGGEFFAQAADDFQTAHIGQTGADEDDLRHETGRGFDAVRAAGGCCDFQSFFGELFGQQLTIAVVVFDQ